MSFQRSKYALQILNHACASENSPSLKSSSKRICVDGFLEMTFHEKHSICCLKGKIFGKKDLTKGNII